MNDAGRIGFVLCGDYDENKTYEFLDVVSYGNGSYAAKKTTTGVAPGNLSTWQKLTEGGASIATASTLGIVKPDNSTIIIDPDGTIHGNSKITVDEELSKTSKNPVENRVITKAIENISTGGSNFFVKTEDVTLFNQNVTVTDGTNTATVKFNEFGDALFDGIEMTGALTFTATNGTLTATNTLEVPYFSNYFLRLEFWAANINISTITSQFNGKTITVKRDGDIVGTTVFASNTATFKATAPGTYTFEATLGWRTFTSEMEITEEKTYTVTLDGFIATIVLTTTTPEFRGLSVEITSEHAPIDTVTFDSSGRASYTAYMADTYTATLQYDGEEYSGSVAVSTETSYSIILDRWTAPISISTTSTQFYSKAITVKKDGVTVGTTSFNAVGDALYNAHATGLYTFEVTVDWRTFSAQCNVVAEQLYSVLMNGYASTINITTPSSEFYGSTVTISADGVPSSTVVLSSSGSATYTALKEGTYSVSLEYNGETYQNSVVVSTEGTYGVTLKYWTATLDITTSSPELYGKAVTIKDSNNSVVGTPVFSNTGKISFAVHKTDTYKISITFDDYTYEKSIVVSAENTYSETLDTWTATVNLTTSSTELYGATIVVTNASDETVGTTAFSNSGSAVFKIHKAGTYTFASSI